MKHWPSGAPSPSQIGGDISTQQSAIVDLAVKSKLLLDSTDVWLLTRDCLINKKKRALLPAVIQRQRFADGLMKCFTTFGLERRVKTKTLAELLNEDDGDDKQAAVPNEPAI